MQIFCMGEPKDSTSRVMVNTLESLVVLQDTKINTQVIGQTIPWLRRKSHPQSWERNNKQTKKKVKYLGILHMRDFYNENYKH